MAHFLEAFMTFLRWDTLLLAFGGASVGLVVGAIPGISGGMTMILFLPLTFALDPVRSIALLMSIHVGAVSGGYIGSVLLGIPGETGSLATTYDGYPLCKNGQAVRALSVSAVASFLGTVPGVLIAMAFCSIIAPWAVKMGPWEIFACGFTAIVMIAALAEGNMFKALFGAAIGLMVTCIGMAPISATPRFSFGLYHLAGGFARVNVIMGFFAGRTIFLEFVRGERIGDTGPKAKISFFKMSLKDFTSNIPNIIRSFGIGQWLGILPGLGASIANVVAYESAKKFSKHPETFGKGNIEGVWAPEVANNACIGGDLIPTIVLGIPGSGSMAYLLMGLTIAGIDAGPLLMQQEPVLVYMIYIALLMGAVGLMIFQIFGMPLFPLILRTPYHYLYPTILVLCFVGAFIAVGNISSAIILIIFTLVGVWFSYAGIPATPFAIGFILGPILETTFRNAISYSPIYGWKSFFLRPVSCTLIVLTIFLLFWPTIKKAILARNAKFKAVIDQVADAGEDED